MTDDVVRNYSRYAAVAVAACAALGGCSTSAGNGGSSGDVASGAASGAATSGATSGLTSSGSAPSAGTNSGSPASGVVAGGTGAGQAAGSTATGSGTAVGSGTASGTATGQPSGASGTGSGTTSSGIADGGTDSTVDAPSNSQPDGDGVFMFDAAGRTPPTCAKPTPPPNELGGAQGSRPSECDVLLQALDFEAAYSYPSPPGSIKITNFGSALGLFQINSCSPYCYAKNLTVGVDIVGGGDPAALKGEIIVEFPAAGPGLPISVADNSRSSLAWMTFDGPAKPAFEIDTQLVVETATGVVPAVETKPFFKPGGNLNPFGPFSVANNYSYNNGCEFKYFPFTSPNGFPNGEMNVTGIGFRITAKATAGQSWHGVLYIDHLQVRSGAFPQNPPNWPGAYPYYDAGL